MKRVAFLFTQTPHGTASGREGLDAVLATGALSEDIGLFFVGDGVYQLLAAQKPQEILARDYIATFGVLSLYDIENIYLCESSAKVRGLADYTDWVLPVQILKQTDIQQQLAEYDTVMTF